MSLTASGFIVFLLSVQVIKGQDGWGVTYSPTEICALKGSTVNIRCSYTYPSRWKDNDTRVEKTFWFSKMKDGERVDLMTDSEYSGRVNNSCNEKTCTLTITDLRKSDSAEYKFRFITNQDGKYTGEPGVTVSVTGPGLTVQMKGSSSNWLECHSSCLLPDHPSYIWYKNGQEVQAETSSSYSGFSYEDSYSCAVKGSEDFPSPPVCEFTVPKLHKTPKISVNYDCECESSRAEGNIVLISKSFIEADLSCLLSLKRTVTHPFVRQPSKSKMLLTIYFSVNTSPPDGPKLPSMSVSPSGEIEEGSSVTLTCSSDANPAARYTWYKENGNLKPLSEQHQLVLSSIQSSDSGQYNCTAENQLGRTSGYMSIDVKYGPKLPSVSVSPSGEIVEGSSVTLTCSSDANPAARYTWYKENQTLLQGPEGIYHLTSISSEDRGSYYCEAQNNRGRRNSTLYLIVVVDKSTMIIMITRLILVVVIPIPLLLFSLWLRKKKSLNSTNEPAETVELDSDPVYANI
ncbi:vascular cell adhesion protein 1-like [Sebastes fasciatus]|uniref:vascular cell adhesion protein 1-like n=1 Tax=Sebastes fasciatus TaxID=394691 RepID=UPI003D9F19E1